MPRFASRWSSGPGRAARACSGSTVDGGGPTCSPSSPARWRRGTGWSSTRPRSTSGSAPAAGTSCTGTWRAARGPSPGAGHIMKLRYTSLQVDTGGAEERRRRARATSGACPVVVCCGCTARSPASPPRSGDLPPEALVAYVMTDGAALPLALSDLVAALRQARAARRDGHRRHAFGGDHEAVNVPSALASPPRRPAPTSSSWRWARAWSARAPRSAPPRSRWPTVLDAATRARRRPDRRRAAEVSDGRRPPPRRQPPHRDRARGWPLAPRSSVTPSGDPAARHPTAARGR